MDATTSQIISASWAYGQGFFTAMLIGLFFLMLSSLALGLLAAFVRGWRRLIP